MHSTSSRRNREQRRAAAAPGDQRVEGSIAGGEHRCQNSLPACSYRPRWGAQRWRRRRRRMCPPNQQNPEATCPAGANCAPSQAGAASRPGAPSAPVEATGSTARPSGDKNPEHTCPPRLQVLRPGTRRAAELGVSSTAASHKARWTSRNYIVGLGLSPLELHTE